MEQRNVTRLSPRQASPPEPIPINPIAALVAAVDAALGDKWSFDIALTMSNTMSAFRFRGCGCTSPTRSTA